ncbi:unnamed protein product [Fraxinus pennsylvanica]|uniref:Bifunctional inhibitor/plant lipid transfer protein/seed storage helical domain-containing protein n=1 Tax=Fraxinus pennsylvanica TaxID=56036 RepID=A0AAD2DIV5_9LAMI|nr:unnamed protein product [Fraxinus pennsylvanica]
MKKAASIALCLAVVVLLLGELHETEAVNCSPLELSSCAEAIMMSLPPSGACCSKLKEQEPCLCGYIKDPSLSQQKYAGSKDHLDGIQGPGKCNASVVVPVLVNAGDGYGARGFVNSTKLDRGIQQRFEIRRKMDDKDCNECIES